MKILVTGANGQVGGELSRSLLVLGEVIALDRARFDLSSPEKLSAILDVINPCIIVNAAAYTAVDQAETEEELATIINGDAVGEIAIWAKRHGVLVIHYSTDYVFDGTSATPYTESHVTSPLSAYGRSKLVGEQMLATVGADYLCLRTTWVYSHKGKNFVNTMLKLGQDRKHISVVSDQIGAPTWARNIADATAIIIAKAQEKRARNEFISGVYNLASLGQTSWYDFANTIFEEAKKKGIVLSIEHVIPIASIDYKTPAIRPLFSSLSNKKTSDEYGVIMPDWKVALNCFFGSM